MVNFLIWFKMMNHRKRKGSIILLIIIFFIPFLLPDWWKNASKEELNSWYPLIGDFVFLTIHYLIYLFSVIVFVLLIAIGIKKKCRLNSNHYYVGVLIVLFIQYVYCINYTEFYPAIIMPSFSNGKINLNEIINNEIQLEIITNTGTIYKEDFQNLLSELPFSMRGSVVERSIESKRKIDQSALIDWLSTKVKIQSNEKIEILKIHKRVFHYSFDKTNGHLSLKNVESVLVDELNN